MSSDIRAVSEDRSKEVAFDYAPAAEKQDCASAGHLESVLDLLPLIQP
jgi:hypothetical protein